jgi:hypothetical protein
MLLKISLTLAILIGLATLYLTHDRLGGKIQALETRAGSAEAAQKAAEDARAKASDEAKKSKAALETANKSLSQTTNFLAQVTKDLEEQRRRANTYQTDLTKTTEDRNEARAELNKWRVIGLEPERIMAELQAKKNLETERNALKEENRSFSRNIQELKTRLRRFDPDPQEPPVPAGTKGKVVAYDPKYEFVVLDIGQNQGIVPDARLLINREGKFITKVKVTHVEPNRSIANIMPEWGKEEVLEGDLAISAN